MVNNLEIMGSNTSSDKGPKKNPDKKPTDSKKDHNIETKPSVKKDEGKEPGVEIINDDTSKNDNKVIFFSLLILVGTFILIFVGLNIYSNYVAVPDVIDIDELHQVNLAGELGNETAYTHNGFSFVKADGLWWTEVVTIINEEKTLVKMPLHYGPRDLVNVTISGELTDDFNKGKYVYISIDPSVINKYYTLGLAELSANLAKGIQRSPVGSCIVNDSACIDRDIVSCDNNPKNLPTIEFVESQEIESQVELLGNCIKITGKDQGIVKAVDHLILSWYGMI